MTPEALLLLAAAHQSELQAAARHQALVRLATCCRPSTLRRALTSARERLVAGRAACCA